MRNQVEELKRLTKEAYSKCKINEDLPVISISWHPDKSLKIKRMETNFTKEEQEEDPILYEECRMMVMKELNLGRFVKNSQIKEGLV